jgi:type VI secretion system protein ImpH
MATPRRRTDPPLEQVLFEEPYRFDFFQAVRLLGRLRPDRASVGHEGHPEREIARFRARQSLDFPPSSIHEIERPEDPDRPPEMTVAFMGLTGPSGVLPRVYTELLIERRRSGDRTPAAFFDAFNHRAISLFYRAWEKYRFVVAREQGRDDRFSHAVFSLLGLGAGPLRDRHEFPDDALLFYAGFFAQRHRPAVVLEAMLRDYFGVPLEVRQFVGRWLKLAPDDRSTSGVSGRHNAVGISTILGSKVWDEQGTIEIRVGPLSFSEFLSHQPDGPSSVPLAQMVRLFVDGEFDVRVRLVLRADEVPPCRLSSAPGLGPRLGRYAWPRSGPFDRDVDDAVFPAPA